MAMDIVTASQGGTFVIILTECWLFIPDESANVASLLNRMRTQVNTLSDPAPSLRDSVNQWFELWGSSGEINSKTYFDYHYLNLAGAYIVTVASAFNAAKQPPDELPPS